MLLSSTFIWCCENVSLFADFEHGYPREWRSYIMLNYGNKYHLSLRSRLWYLFASDVSLWRQSDVTYFGVLVVTRLVYWLVNQCHSPSAAYVFVDLPQKGNLFSRLSRAFSSAFVLKYYKVHFVMYIKSQRRYWFVSMFPESPGLDYSSKT